MRSSLREGKEFGSALKQKSSSMKLWTANPPPRLNVVVQRHPRSNINSIPTLITFPGRRKIRMH